MKGLGGGRRQATTWMLLALVGLGGLTRLAVIGRSWSGPIADPDIYLPLALSLAAGKGYTLPPNDRPTAYRPPLYPIVLAPIVGGAGERVVPGILALHLMLGAGTVVLTSVAALRWGLSRWRVGLAGLIVALDPVLVAQVRSVMTETLAAFLVALTLALLAGAGPVRSGLGGGLAFGLSTLCRPSLLPAAVLTAIAALFFGPGGLRERARRTALVGIGTILVLLPWALHNWSTFGIPIWGTTHSGYTFALANNPQYYDDVLNGAPGAVWGGPGQVAWNHHVAAVETEAGGCEAIADRVFWREGWETVRARPRDFVRAAIARLGRLWGVAPSGAVYPRIVRLETAVWSVPLLIALGVGLLRPENWAWPRVAAPAFIIGLTIVHSLFWTDLRMRAPLVPAVALIVATVGGGAFRQSPPGKNGKMTRIDPVQKLRFR